MHEGGSDQLGSEELRVARGAGEGHKLGVRCAVRLAGAAKCRVTPHAVRLLATAAAVQGATITTSSTFLCPRRPFVRDAHGRLGAHPQTSHLLVGRAAVAHAPSACHAPSLCIPGHLVKGHRLLGEEYLALGKVARGYQRPPTTWQGLQGKLRAGRAQRGLGRLEPRSRHGCQAKRRRLDRARVTDEWGGRWGARGRPRNRAKYQTEGQSKPYSLSSTQRVQ